MTAASSTPIVPFDWSLPSRCNVVDFYLGLHPFGPTDLVARADDRDRAVVAGHVLQQHGLQTERHSDLVPHDALSRCRHPAVHRVAGLQLSGEQAAGDQRHHDDRDQDDRQGTTQTDAARFGALRCRAARRPDRGPEAGPRCPDPASFGVQANCGGVRHALGRPRAAAFAWMVPGELALFGLDELERTKEWAAG